MYLCVAVCVCMLVAARHPLGAESHAFSLPIGDVRYVEAKAIHFPLLRHYTLVLPRFYYIIMRYKQGHFFFFFNIQN